MDMLFSFKNKYHYTYLNTYIFPALLPHYVCALWNDCFGCVEARLSVKGVNKGVVVKLIRERALEGWKPISLFLGVCYR